MVDWIEDFVIIYELIVGCWLFIYMILDWWMICMGNSVVFGDCCLFWIVWYVDVVGDILVGWEMYMIWQYNFEYFQGGDLNMFNGDEVGFMKLVIG